MYSCGSATPKPTSNFNTSITITNQTTTYHDCTFQTTSEEKNAE